MKALADREEAAVRAYRKGAGGLRATASAHGVGVDSLRA